MNINILSSERITIIGQTRSGKSKLSKWIFNNSPAKRKVIINPKGSQSILKDYPAWERELKTPLTNGLHHVIRLVDRKNKHAWDNDLNAVFLAGNTLLWLDELAMMANESQYSQALQNIYQAAGERKVGTIACAQRPVGIPNFAISEVEHLFVFYTQLGSDREKLEKATQSDWSDLLKLQKYHFCYWTQGMSKAEIIEPITI